MFKKRDTSNENDSKELIEQWGSIIHSDLCRLHDDIISKTTTKKEKELTARLQGFKTSISLDSCSGLIYIYEGQAYKNPGEINLDDIEDEREELPIVRAIDTDYLITFIDDIINRR